MFPLFPILILLLLGPANAERLAVEGRLPAALLAVHRSMVAPIRATVVAPVEEEHSVSAARESGKQRFVCGELSKLRWDRRAALCVNWAYPTRAGPEIG